MMGTISALAASTAEMRKPRMRAEAEDVRAENATKGIPAPKLLVRIAIGGILVICRAGRAMLKLKCKRTHVTEVIFMLVCTVKVQLALCSHLA